MANGTDDPIADATPTANPTNEPGEATVTADNTAAQKVVLEYRNTPGPATVEILIALDGPGLPQTLTVDGMAFTLCGTTSDGRPIYGSV